MESNDSPEIRDRGETSDIPGLPSGGFAGGPVLWRELFTFSAGLGVSVSRGGKLMTVIGVCVLSVLCYCDR